MSRGNASALPAIFSTLSGNADDAKALIYMLTMAESPECNVAQARILLSRESSALFKKMESLWGEIEKIPSELRIDGVRQATGALRGLSARERRTFLETLRLLIAADNQLSLGESRIWETVERALRTA